MWLWLCVALLYGCGVREGTLVAVLLEMATIYRSRAVNPRTT